jgi:hypothetical protein
MLNMKVPRRPTLLTVLFNDGHETLRNTHEMSESGEERCLVRNVGRIGTEERSNVSKTTWFLTIDFYNPQDQVS